MHEVKYINFRRKFVLAHASKSVSSSSFLEANFVYNRAHMAQQNSIKKLAKVFTKFFVCNTLV